MNTEPNENVSNADSSKKNYDLPEGVEAITFDEVDNFGVGRDHRLYWKGQELVTRKHISLRGWELTLATLVSVSTTGMFVLQLGSTIGWWGN